MKKVMFVFGTRPEAVKVCPVIKEFQRRGNFEVVVAVTAQHREMLDGVLEHFEVIPDYDLDLMRTGQTVSYLTVRVLAEVGRLIGQEKPSLLMVHGDTTTAFASALAAFYQKVPIGHIEAGLRTGNIYSPYPEEFNRLAVGLVADIHFAPTERARANLLAEGKRSERIFVTGNTVVDALKGTVSEGFGHPLLEWAGKRRIIFLTCHRRENLGEPMRGILRAVKRAAAELEDVCVICPVHKNPAVQNIVCEELGNIDKIALCTPLDLVSCHNVMARSYAILTDSGGIQEEAAALGKPTLVLRESTERPEGVEAGVLRLVGVGEQAVFGEIMDLLGNAEIYGSMKGRPNPYGDGKASAKIAEAVEKLLYSSEFGS